MTPDKAIEALESALASGDFRVRIGDQDVQYRTVAEIMAAISYWRNIQAASKPNAQIVSAPMTTYADFSRS